MPRSRLKTISDKVLADTILEMRDDYGYWDQDPSVFKFTKDGFYALGAKMSKGVREVLKRVEDDGLQAHQPLKRIFDAASSLDAKARRQASEVYEALRDVKRKKEPKPGYAF